MVGLEGLQPVLTSMDGGNARRLLGTILALQAAKGSLRS
jgi:hypothetical protein